MACSLVVKLVGKGDQQGIQVPWLDTRTKAYWGACSLPPSSYQVPWGPGLGMGPRIPQRYCMEHKECKQFPAPQARDSSLYTDPPCVTGGHLGNSPRHRAMTQGLASQIPGPLPTHLLTAHLYHACCPFKDLKTMLCEQQTGLITPTSKLKQPEFCRCQT